MASPLCKAGCGRRVKRTGLNCSKCPYTCIAGCGIIVKKNGFYCIECRPFCDAPVYMDLQPCPNFVKKEGALCNWCRRWETCGKCGQRSLKVDGSCKYCIYKCAFNNCHKYVSKKNMYCSFHEIPCPVVGCSKFIKIKDDVVCFKCQCKTKGCGRQKVSPSKFCANCKSAWLFFWIYYKNNFGFHFPFEITTKILHFADMPKPKYRISSKNK